MRLRKKDYEIIKAGTKEYPMSMNLNVMSELQNSYGTLDEWLKKINTVIRETDENGESKIVSKEREIKAAIETIMLMINEGIDIRNEDEGKNDEKINEKQAGRILTKLGMAKFSELINRFSGEERTDTP